MISTLVDLSDIPLEQFRGLKDPKIDYSTEQVIKQVRRRRVNLGNTGPPGRMD